MPRRGVLPFAGYGFRRRLSPFARKLGRNPKNANAGVLTVAIYHGSRLKLKHDRLRYRREESDTMDDEERVRPFAGRKQTSRPRSPGQLSRFPVAARQSILRNLIARVPIADKYYSGCRTRTRNRACVVAAKMRELRLPGIVSSWRLIAPALCVLAPPDFPCP